MEKNHTEKIACIKEETLFERGKWNGMQVDDLQYYKDLVAKSLEFRVRDDLEEDTKYKQLIAQVVLKHKDRYFLHKQVNRSEARLNSLCPLPLGGHIEMFDMGNDNSTDIIETAMLREMHEEAEVNANVIDRKFLGLVYIEDGNPVNYVHVGFVYMFELDGDDVSIREEGLENIGFVDINYLRENVENLTWWSREIIDYLE
jgi:predicted NUDIX family phosphoesterase